VEFPFSLDLYDCCSDELKTAIAPNRKKLLEIEEQRLQQEIQRKKEHKGKDQKASVKIRSSHSLQELDPAKLTNDTGLYELFAILTHKGRMADSGHYVAWIKRTEDEWIKFDDDKVSPVDVEEIKKLSGKGGGDWHMAYIVLYRAKKVEDTMDLV